MNCELCGESESVELKYNNEGTLICDPCWSDICLVCNINEVEYNGNTCKDCGDSQFADQAWYDLKEVE